MMSSVNNTVFLLVVQDKNSDPSAKAKFEAITLANEVLSNPERRFNYNRFGDYSNKGNE